MKDSSSSNDGKLIWLRRLFVFEWLFIAAISSASLWLLFKIWAI